MAQIATKMKEIAAADTTEDTTVDTTTDTEVDTETSGDTTEGDADTEVDATANAEAEPEATEPDDKPKLFMSPSDQKAPAQQVKAPAQKPRLPDSVRSKIAAEERTKVEGEYSWAQGIPKEEGQNLRALRDLGNTNPVQLIDRLVQSVHANPVTRAALTGYFESIGLVPKGATAQVDSDPMPLPDSAQGYTTEGLKKFNDWQQRQVLAEVDKRVAPLLNDRQQATERAKTNEATQRYATRAVGNIINRPGAKENQEAITAAYNATPRPWKGTANEEDHPDYRTETELLNDAYHTVTAQKNQEAAQKKWAADQKKKAGIGTVNPGSGGSGIGTSTVKKPGTFKEWLVQNSKK